MFDRVLNIEFDLMEIEFYVMKTELCAEMWQTFLLR